jgi:putative acetyltransferase
MLRPAMLIVRPEAPEDLEAIRSVNRLAFGRAAEAVLVDALRAAAQPFLSLVAVQDTQVVGHIAFSPVAIHGEGSPLPALALGPMAVLPDQQRRGIGSRLVLEGLAACQAGRHDLVVVVGHPAFYSRFGFVQAVPRGLRCEYDVPDEAFMVAELAPGALQRGGLVRYHPAFGQLV